MTSRLDFATSFIQLFSMSYCIPIISSYFQKIDENSNNRQPIIFLSSPYIHLYKYIPIYIYHIYIYIIYIYIIYIYIYHIYIYHIYISYIYISYIYIIYIYISYSHIPPVSPRPCASCPRSSKACGCPNRPSSRCCHPHSNTNASFFSGGIRPWISVGSVGSVGSGQNVLWQDRDSGTAGSIRNQVPIGFFYHRFRVSWCSASMTVPREAFVVGKHNLRPMWSSLSGGHDSIFWRDKHAKSVPNHQPNAVVNGPCMIHHLLEKVFSKMVKTISGNKVC